MYQRILVPVDGSATSNRGVQEAISLARVTGGRLRLLHVLDQTAHGYLMDVQGGSGGDWLSLLKEDGLRLLAAAKGHADAGGVLAETVMHEGWQRRLCDVVDKEVQDWQADLVVIGTHGRRGISHLLLGSDAERIVRTSTVPTLLIRLPATALADVEDAAPKTLHVQLPSAALSIE